MACGALANLRLPVVVVVALQHLGSQRQSVRVMESTAAGGAPCVAVLVRSVGSAVRRMTRSAKSSWSGAVVAADVDRCSEY